MLITVNAIQQGYDNTYRYASFPCRFDAGEKNYRLITPDNDWIEEIDIRRKHICNKGWLLYTNRELPLRFPLVITDDFEAKSLSFLVCDQVDFQVFNLVEERESMDICGWYGEPVLIGQHKAISLTHPDKDEVIFWLLEPVEKDKGKLAIGYEEDDEPGGTLCI